MSFKIAMSGREGVWCRVSSQVYFLVNLFSKLYVTVILQQIAFIFGRDEEEDQQVCHVQERQLSHCSLCTYLPWCPRFTLWLTFLQNYS